MNSAGHRSSSRWLSSCSSCRTGRALTFVLAAGILLGNYSRADAEETAPLHGELILPAAPPGYSSRAAVLAAIGFGQLQLIKPTETLPDGVRELRDVEYGAVDGRSLRLDLALPQAVSGPLPALIFVHGGAWSGGERSVYHYYTRRFAARGYAAATISYRLSGEAAFPAAVEDTKCAVRWMRAHAKEYQIDPDRLAVIGGSAGGHLSLMAGYSDDPQLEGRGGHQEQSSRVAAVVNFYGPVDLTSPEAQAAGSVKKFLGGSYEEAPERYKLASPLTHLDAQDPPTLVIHGTIDETVSITQADRLVARLQELNVPHAYQRMEGWPHTLDAVEVANEHCQQLMMLFFDRYLSAQR